MSWPFTVTAPAVGFTIPQMMLIRVVLPAPLGPSSAKISPGRMSRLMLLSASKPEAYVLERLATEMMGCMRGTRVAAGRLVEMGWRGRDGDGRGAISRGA